jgi:CheY-like chemotaxis protein
VEADAAQQAVHFSVWDTGIGIEPEKMTQLFKPFVQIDGGLNRQHEGTGLGLALVSRLTEMHGGSVHVESEPGKGSRFTVSLPWLNPETINATPHSSTAAESRPSLGSLHRALLIEDSPTAAEQMMRYLEDLHIAPEIINQGDQAIEQAIVLKPDVIILDILLPDVSGWDVLGALKSDPRTSHIPIIIVSNIDDKPRGLELGADAYLVKPIGRQEVHNALQKIIEPAQAEPPKALMLVPGRTEAPAEDGSLILLAEDNEDNSVLLADYLKSKGYQVTIARNGNEAVTAAREQRPALILMDIQMPGMDGLEATRRIRESSDLRHIPIIALTALAMPGDRERCLEAGSNDYMSKPIKLRQLLQMITRLLNPEHA